MWIVPVSKPFGPSSSRIARPGSGLQKPLVGSSTGRETAAWRGLRAWLHRTQARGGGPHTHHGAANAHAPMGWHVCRSRQWGLSRWACLGFAGHLDLLEALRAHLRGRSSSSRWAIWRCGGDRAAHPGRRQSGDARERLSHLGASPTPACAGPIGRRPAWPEWTLESSSSCLTAAGCHWRRVCLPLAW